MTKPKKNTIAVLNAHSSFNSSYGKDALDVALIFGSYEQQVALFFQGEGVRQLVAQQNAELINTKDYLATFSALEFYDVEKLYVCAESLKQRNLSENFHVDNVDVLNAEEFSQQLKQHQTILRF
ncbi:MAG: sulfurtransferase complex subunit TusC [Gammaproteobacteria bacterium]|nr:MAG: sulfurtransferase complex subunit TusC [Gammaproteobacteria bacterium]